MLSGQVQDIAHIAVNDGAHSLMRSAAERRPGGCIEVSRRCGRPGKSAWALVFSADGRGAGSVRLRELLVL